MDPLLKFYVKHWEKEIVDTSVLKLRKAQPEVIAELEKPRPKSPKHPVHNDSAQIKHSPSVLRLKYEAPRPQTSQKWSPPPAKNPAKSKSSKKRSVSVPIPRKKQKSKSPRPPKPVATTISKDEENSFWESYCEGMQKIPTRPACWEPKFHLDGQIPVFKHRLIPDVLREMAFSRHELKRVADDLSQIISGNSHRKDTSDSSYRPHRNKSFEDMGQDFFSGVELPQEEKGLREIATRLNLKFVQVSEIKAEFDKLADSDGNITKAKFDLLLSKTKKIFASTWPDDKLNLIDFRQFMNYNM
jgi:hypothetical protein